jgi:hypothetical protein
MYTMGLDRPTCFIRLLWSTRVRGSYKAESASVHNCPQPLFLIRGSLAGVAQVEMKSLSRLVSKKLPALHK